MAMAYSVQTKVSKKSSCFCCISNSCLFILINKSVSFMYYGELKIKAKTVVTQKKALPKKLHFRKGQLSGI